MTESRAGQLVELETILANQRALGKRFVWLLILPLVLSAVLLAMFYVTSRRLTDVEVVTRQLTIERLLADDSNYKMAVEQYKQIARVRETPPILARLGLLLFQLDHKSNAQQAIDTLQEGLRLDPSYWETYRYLSYVYSAIGQTENAIKTGEQGLKLNPYDAKLYNNLAWTYATSESPYQDIGRAQQYAEKARDLTESKHPEVLDTLAEVYIRKGGDEYRGRARELLRKANEIAANGDTTFKERFETAFPGEHP